MAKDQTIILRVEAETKRRLELAAQERGLSLSAFLLSAAEKAARRGGPARRVGPEPGSGACPTFFKALVETARSGGGAVDARGGYEAAGYELTRHLGDLIDHDDPAEGQARLDELAELAEAGDVAGAFAWFDRELPRCAALVPLRRRGRFIEGVRRRIEDGGGLSL